MPRKSHTTHPDHVRTSASKLAPATQTDDATQSHRFPIVDPLEGSDHHGMVLLATVLDRDDGWLRVVPDRDAPVVWWKWKFVHGPHAGGYVMVRGAQDQHIEALRVLARKLRSVDVGSLRPTKDTYYDQG